MYSAAEHAVREKNYNAIGFASVGVEGTTLSVLHTNQTQDAQYGMF
jgi:hypothetical protein